MFANLAFISYGAARQFKPILALHLILLPIDVVRLRHSLASERHSHSSGGPGRAIATSSRDPDDQGSGARKAGARM